LVSQRVTNPLGAQASGLCSSPNSRAETGFTDPGYKNPAQRYDRIDLSVARRASTKHDAAAIAVKSPATAL
jgi:hypothetical protein